MFESIKSNKRRTYMTVAFVFAFLYAVIWFIGYWADMGNLAFVLAFIVSFFSSFFSYFYSDKIILTMMKARPADDATDKKVKNAMEGLVIAAGVPMPRVYIIEDDGLNAFATGRNPKNGVVCVTRGLVNRLDYYQLEGVLAHELAHIKNYDILLSTVVTVMVGTVVILSHWFTRMAFYGGGRGKSTNKGNNGKGQAIIMVVGLIFMILAPIFGQILKLALSRNREYLADATAVEFTRNPEGLAGALEAISTNSAVESADPATSSMFIASPISHLDKKKNKGSLFDTHPPIQERVRALRAIR